jgi:hypothetical protein
MFIHAHCQGRDHRGLGSWEDEPPSLGAHRQLLFFVCPRLTHCHTIKYVSGQFLTAYRSTIGTDSSPSVTPSQMNPLLYKSRYITLRSSSLLPPLLTHHRILLDKNTFHSSLLYFSVEWMTSFPFSTSIGQRRCALSTVGGRSFARADLSVMRKWNNSVLS